MKKLLSLLMVLVILLVGCSQKPEEKYPPQKQDFGGGDYTWHYYNDEGLRIRYESYRDDALQEIHTFELDADGNVTLEMITDADGNEIKHNVTTYENGLRNYKAIYHGDILVMEDWYNKDDRTILSKIYDDAGNLESWYECFYDTEYGDYTIFYRADDTVYLMQQYGTDENGRFTTTRTEVDENGDVVKIVLQTNTQNGYKEEILFEKAE